MEIPQSCDKPSTWSLYRNRLGYNFHLQLVMITTLDLAASPLWAKVSPIKSHFSTSQAIFSRGQATSSSPPPTVRHWDSPCHEVFWVAWVNSGGHVNKHRAAEHIPLMQQGYGATKFLWFLYESSFYLFSTQEWNWYVWKWTCSIYRPVLFKVCILLSLGSEINNNQSKTNLGQILRER